MHRVWASRIGLRPIKRKLPLCLVTLENGNLLGTRRAPALAHEPVAAQPTKALCFFTRHLPDSKGILRGFVSKSDAEKADAVRLSSQDFGVRVLLRQVDALERRDGNVTSLQERRGRALDYLINLASLVCTSKTHCLDIQQPRNWLCKTGVALLQCLNQRILSPARIPRESHLCDAWSGDGGGVLRGRRLGKVQDRHGGEKEREWRG
jgi:hypothetical protein